MEKYLYHKWIDHTAHIDQDCLFFLIEPKTIGQELLDQRIKFIISKLPSVNFYLCPVDISDYEYPSNVTVLPRISYNQYEYWVSKKYFKKPKKIIGVTGTSGKTSTCNLIKNTYDNNGYKWGVIGTNICSIPLDNYRGDIPVSFLGYHEFLHKSAEDFEGVVMECSSYSIEQKRINNIVMDAVVFTSFTPDHIDFHKSLLGYFLAKMDLLNYLKPNGSVFINHNIKLMDSFLNLIDKPVYLIENLWNFTDFYNEDYGVTFNTNIKKIPINIKNNKVYIENWSFDFNNNDIFQINNLIMSAIVFSSLENKKPIVKNQEIIGRFNELNKNNISIFIDYCHSLEKVKYFINMLKKYLDLNKLNKKIIIVIGIGSKEIDNRFPRLLWLVNNVDHIILTQDNIYQDFNPQKYIDTMKSYPNVTYVPRRDEAVLYALDNYGNDQYIIGCLGIGADNNLQINDEIIQYNEYNFIKKYLDNL